MFDRAKAAQAYNLRIVTPPPSELVQWLPADLPVEQIDGWVHLERSFDRVSGESLVVRYSEGRTQVLTRPEAREVFRELPLAAVPRAIELVVQGSTGVLQARVVDGRVVKLPLTASEAQALADLLGKGSASGDPNERASSEQSAPWQADQVGATRNPDASGRRRRPGTREQASYDRATTGYRAPTASVRPPGGGDVEVVRVPRTVRPAVRVPSRDETGLHAMPLEPEPGARTNPFYERRASTAAYADLSSRVELRDDSQRGTDSHVSPRPRSDDATRPVAVDASRDAGEPRRKGDSFHPPEFQAKPLPIVRSARDIDALRASFQHHWGEGALDEASQVARALVHLGQADTVEKRLAELRPEVSPEFETALTPYLFRAYLAHDDEDPDLGRLLAAIAPAYLHMRARPEHEAGLHTRDEVDPQTSLDSFVRLFGHAARAFGLPCPRLFLRRDVAGGMAHLHLLPVASLCGGTLATGFDSQSTLHVLGHHMSLYRPEVYLYALAPAPADQHALVLAALHLEGRLTVSDRRVAVLADTLGRHMGPSVRDTLRQACSDLSLPSGEEPRLAALELIRRSRRAAFLTAVRAGFALSGSLAVSDRMQRMMPAVPGVTPDEMIDDLVTYSVSPSWMALRKELGLAFDPSGEDSVPSG